MVILCANVHYRNKFKLLSEKYCRGINGPTPLFYNDFIKPKCALRVSLIINLRGIFGFIIVL